MSDEKAWSVKASGLFLGTLEAFERFMIAQHDSMLSQSDMEVRGFTADLTEYLGDSWEQVSWTRSGFF